MKDVVQEFVHAFHLDLLETQMRSAEYNEAKIASILRGEEVSNKDVIIRDCLSMVLLEIRLRIANRISRPDFCDN